MPDYFVIPELPDRPMFTCVSRRATLAVAACSDMWKLAQDRHAPERTWMCRNCPIGAEHAGFGEISLSPLRGASVCARCDEGTTRLIRGHLCVSCYNREREAVIGRNARGTAPVKHPPLHRMSIRFMADGELTRITIDRAVSTKELIIAALRDNPRRVVFGFTGHRPALKQRELFE